MASVLHRTTFEYRGLVNTPDFDSGVWVINPDLTPVAGAAKKYWVLTGDILSVMDQAAQDAVDAALALATTAAEEAANTAINPATRIITTAANTSALPVPPSNRGLMVCVDDVGGGV